MPEDMINENFRLRLIRDMHGDLSKMHHLANLSAKTTTPECSLSFGGRSSIQISLTIQQVSVAIENDRKGNYEDDAGSHAGSFHKSVLSFEGICPFAARKIYEIWP